MLRRLSSLAVTAVLSAACLVASTRTAGAGPFTLQTGVGANVGCVPSGGPPTGCPEINGDRDSSYEIAGPINGAGFVTVSNLTDPFNDAFFTYSAQADASFGSLHAEASGSFDLPTAGYRSAFAFAASTDQLTISAPGQSGQGTLDVSFLLEGLVQQTGKGGAAVLAGVSAGPDPDAFSVNNQSQGFDGSNPPTGPITFSVNFVWGQPFYLSMILGTGVGTQISCLACNNGDSNASAVTGTGTATADFFNTLTLTGLVPIANGSPVRDAQFSSASGTQYSVNGVAAVPEPASLVLLGSGLAFALRRRRRG